MPYKKLIYSTALACLFLCTFYEFISVHKNSSDDFKTNVDLYRIRTPSEVFVLDNNLKEISSLAYDKKRQSFLSNNDEHGNFYILDPYNFSIKEKIKFGKKGDYEGITTYRDQIVISKSNGDIFFYNKKDNSTKSIKTLLKTENDIEGICYDPKQESLLIACKGKSALDHKASKKIKSIFKFDMSSKRLINKAFLEIKQATLKKYIKETNKHRSEIFLKILLKKIKHFAPSGIAIHPITGNYYIISARGSILVEYDPQKNLKSVNFFDPKNNPQPEGITFDKEANLYIATEGDGGRGKILKFNKI